MAEIKSVVKLIETAKLHPGGAMPASTHQSFPIPVPSPKGLRMAFLYCKAMVVEPRQGLKIWSPSYLAFVNAESGRFEELKAASGKDFGQKDGEDRPIGSYFSPPERLAAEFIAKQASLYQAYDVLLPAFAEEKMKVPPEIKRAAAEFDKLFSQVAEKPLLPYYQALGQRFFDWLAIANL